MTGAGAVHAAYTSTGHQAQRVVPNPSAAGADVVTDFHGEEETAQTLIYGCNWNEIYASSGGSGSFNSSQTFTFSNDVDAIGDIYARVEMKLTAASAGATANDFAPQLALARVIDRCEVMVGNGTWQTLENADILAMNATMMSNGAYDVYDLQARGAHAEDSAINDTARPTSGTDVRTCVCWVPLPIFTMGGPARAHLTAGAPHQSFRIKLTYTQQAAVQNANITASDLEIKLFARTYIMGNFERDQIRANTIAKTLHLTQHAEKTPSSTEDTIELDAFSLLASHLVIVAEGSSDNPAAVGLKDAELLLNTATHSGKLDGSFLFNGAGHSMGLQTNFVSDLDTLDTSSTRRRFYVFPIASSAFGPDGCPLNRFDTIRLRCNWVSQPSRVYVTCVGTASAVYSKQAASLQYHA